MCVCVCVCVSVCARTRKRVSEYMNRGRELIFLGVHISDFSLSINIFVHMFLCFCLIYFVCYYSGVFN